MRQRIALCGLVLAVLVAPVPAPAAESDGPATVVKLKTVPLRKPDLILSKADLWEYRNRQPSAWICILPKGVRPKETLALTKGAEPGLSIGGTTISFLWDGAKFCCKTRGKTAVMKKVGYSLSPQELTLADRRKYILALPCMYTSENEVQLCYRCGCVQQGKLGKFDINLFDANTDGFYTVSDDAVFLSDGFVAAPLSELIATPEEVYRLENVPRDGSELSVRKYDGETGTLSVKLLGKGIEAQLAFGSEDGKLNFAIATNKDSCMTVVPGKYKLLYGLAYTKSKTPAAAVIPAGSAPFEVAAGKETTVEIGAPFQLVFEPDIEGRTMKLRGNAIRVAGRAGEEYLEFEYKSRPNIYSGGKCVGTMGFG